MLPLSFIAAQLSGDRVHLPNCETTQLALSDLDVQLARHVLDLA